MVQLDARVLVGWLVFDYIYMSVWDASISNMVRLASTVTRQVTPAAPLGRAYLFVLGSYSACRATLLVALYMLLMFCVMSCVQCVIPFMAHVKWLHPGMRWVFAEDVLFRPMSPRLLPFHAAVLVASLTVAAVYSVAYASDADLADPDRCTSVVVRQALCMPLLGVCAYLAITLSLCIITPP